jgi:ribonuclease HII
MSEPDFINYVSNQYDSLNVGDSFFSNNSAYKNTIATGSLSVIASLPIKQLIAEYYEELSVKLSDNNRNLDNELNEYMSSVMANGNSLNSEVSKKFAKLSRDQVLEEHKKNPAFKAAILSPTFTIHTNKFEMRCDYYLYLMKRFQSVNSQLLAALEKADA